MTNEIHDHLLALGFATEIGGGGCEMLSRYLPHGVAIWVTGTDGPSLPDDDDWLICVYEPDGGGSMSDARLTLASTTTPAAQYLAAISAAEAFAQVLDSQPRRTRWLAGNAAARAETLGADFAYADELAATLGGVQIVSDQHRPVAAVPVGELLHCAACLWEQALNINAVYASPREGVAEAWAGRPEREFLREWADEGTVHMRVKVTGWADECERDWKRAHDAGEFDEPFDWEWVPRWLANKLREVYPTPEAVAPATVDLNGRRMVPGDLHAGLTLAELTGKHLASLYAYPAEGGAK